MSKPIYLRTLIQAHRGASAYAPENTLPAFAMAAEMRADGVELDVHFTRDGYVVVCHDGNVARTSDGTGEIKDLTLAELRKMSFHGRFAEKYAGTRIPTLDEVYELLRPTGLMVNVEIKASGADFVREVYEVAARQRMLDNVIYSSFDYSTLRDMKAVDPNTFTAPLYGEMAEPWFFAHSIGAGAIHPEQRDVLTHDGYVDHAHAMGIRVHPWTVDSEESLIALTRLGVDAVISNKPDFARETVLAAMK